MRCTNENVKNAIVNRIILKQNLNWTHVAYNPTNESAEFFLSIFFCLCLSSQFFSLFLVKSLMFSSIVY